MDIKRDVARIIDKGTPKERANLYFSNRAELNNNKPGFLTEEEANRLEESFKTQKEIALFDKYLTMGRAVRDALIFLNQILLAYNMKITSIRGKEELWGALSETAKNINKALSEVKDKETRAKITKTIINTPVNCSFIFDKDKDGYIVLKSTKPKDLESPITDSPLVRETISMSSSAYKFLILGKSIVKALQDYIRENRFTIKEYKNQLKEIETDLKRDKSLTGLAKLRTPDEQYIYPNYNDLKVDDEAVKKYRETYFND